jgi:exopolyphosphatase/guanosine-5'-triphosphate,3'-diphosphate pyrophosphatase
VDAGPLLVIDCGTSSIRAFIAEVAGGRQRILEDIIKQVDLTEALTDGKLGREAMDAVEDAIAGILAAAKGYGVGRVRAVATTGLREAGNADVLVERLRSRFGLDLDVIDAAEEARLYVAALRERSARCGLDLTGEALLIEIGGGGSCVSLVRDGKLVHTVDEHYGTHRIHQQFRDMRDSMDYALSIDRFAEGAARMMLVRLPSVRVPRLIVTGSVVRRLFSLVAGSEPGEGEVQSLGAKPVDAWYKSMRPLTPSQRAERCGCDTDRAAMLLPAAALIRHLCAITGAESILVPPITLRDGLLADLLPGAPGPHHLDSSHLLAEARQLVSRYGGDLVYAENTASLAVQLFDQTRAMHALGDRERTLLEFSALVHDVGSYINVRNRHKHTMYIIEASDLAGLTADEKDLVAQVARYHRKSPPEPHHTAFTVLPRRSRVLVSALAAMLRIAYALDVERSQRIKRIRAEISGRELLIHVDRRQVALEQWSVAGKSGLFTDVFGLGVRVVPRQEQ